LKVLTKVLRNVLKIRLEGWGGYNHMADS